MGGSPGKFDENDVLIFRWYLDPEHPLAQVTSENLRFVRSAFEAGCGGMKGLVGWSGIEPRWLKLAAMEPNLLCFQDTSDTVVAWGVLGVGCVLARQLWEELNLDRRVATADPRALVVPEELPQPTKLRRLLTAAYHLFPEAVDWDKVRREFTRRPVIG